MDTQALIQALLNELLQIVITIVIPFVGAYLVSLIKKHLTAKQIEIAKNIAGIAVKFAQQSGLANADKFQLAFNTVKSMASQHGIKLTDEQWTSLVEAAVNEFKKDWNTVTRTESVTPTPEITM
ncbi:MULTISPECIES: phage holin family protein [unclassified Dehalobacter]|jgi:phage holin, LL-H family|uniref:phage holin family protein n=1 Tax=unclassified Dehalobacter TaxID=2635733 RepID=UPI00028A8D0F|nr:MULTISPECIES: phage holin family protein [unclassified Dehalobacter]AFV02811.1 Phage holin protein (Holin_LLH) [Dehalobacter sp. DCA]AFV05796.1 Phage holin protein (Holin_LLH) [Dehalobacter sp. CF]